MVIMYIALGIVAGIQACILMSLVVINNQLQYMTEANRIQNATSVEVLSQIRDHLSSLRSEQRRYHSE